MELRQLEYFLAVCEELHFTRAAEKLNIAQPTLSQQIKTLEGEAGIPLFDRIGKKIALTEAGKILLKHTQQAFYELEQAKTAIRDLNGLERGKLTIGSLLTCVNYLLPSVIMHFKQLYPNIELSVLGLRTGDIEKGILENELDLGVTFLPIENGNMESIPLFAEELALAVPVNHQLAFEAMADLQIITQFPLILMPKSYYLRQLIDTYCNEIGINPEPALELTTLESLTQMVAKGLGVTILPVPYLEHLNNQAIQTVKLAPPIPKRKIGIVYRKDKFMCTATKAFINKLTTVSETIK
ncbi:LysR family transcriptional regulator [Ralstonia pickettii]|nr:LysR family transcriptional regulator [Ralstonia pickettii]